MFVQHFNAINTDPHPVRRGITITLPEMNLVPVPFDVDMTATEVAQSIELALANAGQVGGGGSGSLFAEPNDTMSNPVVSGLLGGSGTFRSSGFIGDNPNLSISPELDVDMIEVQLNAGDLMTVDIDAYINGSSLDPMLRVFDATGTEVDFFRFDASSGNGSNGDISVLVY